MPSTAEAIIEQCEKLNNTETCNKEGKDKQKTKAQLKAERKAAFEAQRSAVLDAKEEHDSAAKPKSKAQLRAERRALQEAQRANKASKNENAVATKEQKSKQVKINNTTNENQTEVVGDTVVANSSKLTTNKTETKLQRKGVETTQSLSMTINQVKDTECESQQKEVYRKVRLFSHLPLRTLDHSATKNIGLSGSAIHSAIVRLGLKTTYGTISGSNSRCVALLAAFKEVIQDYVTPSQKELSRDLETKVKSYINFLDRCRPLSISMVNAVKFLRWQITHIPTGTTDVVAKSQLCKAIDDFIHVEIELAQEAISRYANEKISDGDVIMTYACSSLVIKVLCDAYKSGKHFRVIVVDSRPKLEGRIMLKCLMRQGIPCSYVLINAVSYVMREVTSVFLGAHSLQANGYVMSRIGSSQIALVARSYNVPVLVCCETYKFCERVHTDAFVHNELGDPDDLVKITSINHLNDWKDIPSLHLLNLLYDVTPPDLVAMVITEKDKLPCTSVPVVLRVKSAGIQDI